METIQPLERKPAQPAGAHQAGRVRQQGSRGRVDDRWPAGSARQAAYQGRPRTLCRHSPAASTSATSRTSIVEALDPDKHVAVAASAARLEDDEAAIAAGRAAAHRRSARSRSRRTQSCAHAIIDVRKSYEQTIDEVSKDAVLFAGHSEEGREKAAALVTSFKEYIEEHKDDIRALQILYSRPYNERLTFAEIKELAKAIERPPRQWTPEKLWRAYELLDQSKVRGSGGRMLTDIVSLVRYTLDQDDELVPFRDQVEARFAAWLLTQEQPGVVFTDEQTAVADVDEGEHRERTWGSGRVVRVHALRRARRASARRIRCSATGLAPLMDELHRGAGGMSELSGRVMAVRTMASSR